MKKITRQTAVQKIQQVPSNQMFHVKFIKRTNGEEREMLCRYGVKKFLTPGAEKKYNPKDHNLVHVFDMGKYKEALAEYNSPVPESIKMEEGKKCYRSINLEMIMTVKIDGEEFIVNEFPVLDYRITWSEQGTNKERGIKARTEAEAWVTFKREMSLDRKPRGAGIQRVLEPVS